MTGHDEAALKELIDDPGSRKRFFRMAGAGAAGAFALLLGACGDEESGNGSAAQTQTTTGEEPTPTATADDNAGDIEIVNYALTLEYLEADFYQQVIDSGLVEDKMLVELAKTIGEHESAHVDALKQTVQKLGGNPANKPNTTFEEVLNQGLDKVLETAATVENLGAAAYLGQAPKIKSQEILAAALSIHTVEARHAAALNSLVGRGFAEKEPLEGSIPNGAFAKPMTMDEVLEQAQAFIVS